jgi:signal transduction histidine kinase
MRELQHFFERLSLPVQVLVCGLVCSSLASWVGQRALALPGLGIGAAFGIGVLVTLVAAGLALRSTRVIDDITQAARASSRDDHTAPSGMPVVDISRELHAATQALFRLQEAQRQRLQAMEARNAQLGVALQSRTLELSSLQDLSIGLAQQGDISALVSEALGALEQTLEFSSASVWARLGLEPRQPVALLGYRSNEGTGPEMSDLAGLRLSRANLARYEQIEADGQPIIENHPRQGLLSWLWAMVTDDARSSALYRGTRAWTAVPLKVRDTVLGVLRVDHGEPGHFDEPRVRLLTAVGSQTALAMRHAHLLARERDMAVVGERNRIARELHDAVSQTLFAANLLAGTMARAPDQDPAVQRQAQILEKLNRSALAEMRMLLFELRPDALQGVRLIELLQQAVEALSGRGEIVVSAQLDPGAEPPAAQRVQVYRIAQEALSNIARHSGAAHAEIRWSLLAPGRGRLCISDDGAGFDPQMQRAGHFGLDNMRSRARELGAELLISSGPDGSTSSQDGRTGGGTRIQLDLSWEAR